MGVPSFDTVPDGWKSPFGPYHQAPPEFGGKWYYVSPFRPTPWETAAPAAAPLPQGFEAIFGARPRSEDFHGAKFPPKAYQAAKNEWEKDLKRFKSAGPPEWASTEQLAQTNAIFERWGLGTPLYYEGRYGFMAAFVSSQLPDYETAAFQVLNYSHFVVAQYQLSLISSGLDAGKIHPFVPPHVLANAGGKHEPIR